MLPWQKGDSGWVLRTGKQVLLALPGPNEQHKALLATPVPTPLSPAVHAGAKGAASKEAEYTLLVLDPGCPTRPLADALQRRAGWQRMIKRGLHTLRKPQYQLLWCDPGLAQPGGAKYEALKIIAAAERY